MNFQVSVTIDAPLERVWQALIDVERWPESTASITSLERLDAGPFGLGSRARIKQPKFPPLIWTVTEFQPMRHFSWSVVSPGSTTVGGHSITPGPGKGVTLTLSIKTYGSLAGLVDLLTSGITRRYVNMEAAGMKRVSEAKATSLPTAV